MKTIIMVNKLKIIMHYIVVVALTIILNINLIEATCNKKHRFIDDLSNRQQQQQQHQQQQQQHPQQQNQNHQTQHHHQLVKSKTFPNLSRKTLNHTIIERSIRKEDDYYLVNNNDNTANNNNTGNHYVNNTADFLQQDLGIELHSELDNLRLEYYKYKILSHLKMKAEPDELNPDLNMTLRNELLSTLTKNSNNNHYFRKERRDNGIANVRHKRSLACNQVKSNKDACCLETFYVNFTDIGWDKWIIYPPGYNANYCRGQCDLSHSRYYHSTLLSKFSNVIGLCCSPKQMEPLRLLYIDENNKVHQKSMPDMIVESCDCA